MLTIEGQDQEAGGNSTHLSMHDPRKPSTALRHQHITWGIPPSLEVALGRIGDIIAER